MARDGARWRLVARGAGGRRCYVRGVVTLRFHPSMGIAATVVTIAGFTPGLFSTTRLGPVTPLVALHAALAFAWLLLFVVQATLAGRGTRDLHRRLGVGTLALAAALVVTGYLTSIAAARRGFDLSGDLRTAADPLGSLVFPLGDLVSFTALVTLGALWRRRPDRHKRVMLLATVGSLMAAPLAHLIGQFPALHAFPPIILLPLCAFYFASAVHDRLTEGRIHPVSLWGAIALLVWAQGRAALVGPSDAWHRFAAWLIR